jgi:hypothetical protein
MVQEGKITAEEGVRLLQAVEKPVGEAQPTRGARWLRLRVTDTRTGKNKVNINVPAGLITWALKFVPDWGSAERSDILSLVNQGGVGKILDVLGDDGERVEITIE